MCLRSEVKSKRNKLLPGGKTAHLTFKIPFDIMDDCICSILKNSALAKVLQSASLLIWDECSAQHRFAFKAVDRTLRDLRNCEEIFGGITTILGGDFLQTLPVIKGNQRSPVVHSCLLSSPLWCISKPMFLNWNRTCAWARLHPIRPCCLASQIGDGFSECAEGLCRFASAHLVFHACR